MNNAKWIVALFVIYIAGQVDPLKPRRLGHPRVVGGFQVKITTVPFLLALHVKEDSVGRFRCGAVIISASWGMSAQHCFNLKESAGYYVRAGSSLNIIGGTIHRLKKLYFYNMKYFDGKSLPQHDIVLFTVAPHFRFAETVKPAKLPAVGSIPPKLLQVSGWGRTDMSIEAFPLSMFAQSANVSRVEWSDCVRANDWYEYVVRKRRHLCYGEGNADACYGDSGGPLADSDTVYGIVSFGDDCGIGPGVYTNVAFYRRWIKRIANV